MAGWLPDVFPFQGASKPLLVRFSAKLQENYTSGLSQLGKLKRVACKLC